MALNGLGGVGGVGAAGGANPLGGMAGASGLGGSMSGMADLGVGTGTGGEAGSQGMAPNSQATSSQGASFGDTLRSMVIENPSASKAASSEMAARFAAGDTSIDPHQVALQSAKAGVEIQMATRTISSAVSAVRTLFQMQV